MNMQSFATALVVAIFIETTLLMVLKLRQRNPKVARGSILLDTSSIMRAAGGARASDVVAEAPERRSVGAVAASDAFFPFADGLQVLIDAGVSAVVQPGGSVRDQESIDAANAAGITMYLTGTRHFAH